MGEDTLSQVSSVLERLEFWNKEVAYKTAKIDECNANIKVLELKKDLILRSKEYHKKAIDLLYQSSIKELEDLINDVVAAVFYDRNLKVKMDLSDSRSKSLSWYIIDEDEDTQMSIRNGVGRGVRTVISFILQSYYLLSFGSKFMFIDEGYSFISEAYVGKFFEFVKLLCKERGLALVMISHDARFMGYADAHYNVISGTVSKKK